MQKMAVSVVDSKVYYLNMLGFMKMKEETSVIVRTVFLIVAFVHLVFTAIYSLSIDTTVDEDPRVRAYYYIRWLLLTCWFNLVTLAYLPTRIYCEWKTLQGHGDSDCVKKLNRITDIVMTGVLVPTTLYADMAFWIIYKFNPPMMAPVKLFTYMPDWAQHSLHTVSVFVIIADLMLTPRTRPRSVTPHLILLNTFLSIYFYVMFSSLDYGITVYPILEHMSTAMRAFAVVTAFLFHWIVFKLEWILIEARWGKVKDD